MAIRITQSPTFRADVEALIPSEVGIDELHKFKLQFKRVATADLDALLKKGNTPMLQEIVVGWSDVLMDDGTPLEFSPANLDNLLKIPQAVVAMSKAFWTAQAKSKQGN